MRDLGPSDAGHDSQRKQAAAFEAQRVIQAGAALLDHRKVERGCIGDRLHLIGSVEALIFCRDRRSIHNIDHLAEGIAEIRIARASVTQIPTRIHVQMHQVGQPQHLIWRHGAARERAEPLKTDAAMARFHEERVQKILVTELVICVLRHISGHVVIDRLQCVAVRSIQICKFRVLLPEIRLQHFPRGQES